MPLADSSMLNEISFFSALDDDERRTLAQQIDLIYLPKGHTLFRTGDPGGAMYLVHSGAIELYLPQENGDHLPLKVAERGEMFGELALLDNQPRSANALAIEPSELLVLDRDDLSVLFEKHPDSAFDIITVLTRRVRETTDLYAMAAIRNANEVIDAEMEIEGSASERIADWMTEIASSIPFLYTNAGLFAIWILVNVGVFRFLRPFDPYPFGFLTMSVSLEAIFLSLFVLISQNRQAKRDKIRNDIEYEVNIRAEKEVRALAIRLNELEETVTEQFERLSDFGPSAPAASAAD